MATNPSPRQRHTPAGGQVLDDRENIQSWGDAVRLFNGSADLFDIPTVRNTRNIADIGSHYPFNPERLRLFLNGTRQFPQYGAVADFSDNVDHYSLSPSTNGDVMTIETAERFRYVIGYTMSPSYAFRCSQALQSGDKVTIGYGDADLENDMANADGFILEFEPDLEDNQARAAIYRAGTVVTNGGTKKVITFENDVTVLRRLYNLLDWYGIGPFVIGETFTENGFQRNDIQGRVSNDDSIADGRSSEIGNHHIQLSIQSGGNGTALEVGSIGMDIFGEVSALQREKQAPFINESVTDTGVFEPIRALRVKPSFKIVTAQLTSLDILSYGGSNSVSVTAMAFAESKVNFGNDGWTSPPEWNSENNAIESRTDITGYPDVDGNNVTSADTWTTDPGGYQVGTGIFSGSGTGANRSTGGERREVVRPFNHPDIVVLLANAEGTANFDYEVTIRQDW